MFGSLFTPRHRTAALFPDGMDRHTHILWGVDDGASTPQESLAIIRTLKSLGFSGAYCTPHIKASCPGNTPDKLRRRFNELLSAAAGEAFKLELAAEYMLDDLFENNSGAEPCSPTTEPTCWWNSPRVASPEHGKT